jgi:hypothetical protein
MKLSKHPEGTVIQIIGEGQFTKGIENWYRAGLLHRPTMSFKEVNKLQKNSPHLVRIQSAPWSIVVELMAMVLDECGARDNEGNLITFDSVYKDAMKRDEESKQRRAQSHIVLHNYANADVRATEQLFNRVMRPSVIYKTQKI